jgi:glycosyltransferase involved in cell wall biosynthesis
LCFKKTHSLDSINTLVTLNMKVLMLAKIDSSHTKKWALALKDQGIKVALFSIHLPNNDDWYKKLDYVFFPKKNITSSGFFAKLSYISIFFSLKHLIKNFKPDILHSHFATHYSFLGNLSGFRKHVVTVWGSDVFVFPKKRKLNRLIFKFNLKHADCIISTSKAMAKEVALYSSKEINIIPFGIDLNMFKPHHIVNLNRDEIIIGNIKSLEPIYGIDILIMAFDLVKRKFPLWIFKLIIVGKGSKLLEYQKLVKDLGLENSVVFKGNVLPEDVPAILNTFTIFACLSRNESFGVSVIEAMACKIPVVVTKTPGFLEVVNSKENGLFVEINNANDAAEKISILILDKKLIVKNTNNALDRVKRLYNLNDNINKQIELYKMLLS